MAMPFLYDMTEDVLSQIRHTWGAEHMLHQ